MLEEATLYCELKDFLEIIPDLPQETELIKSQNNEAHFPALVNEANLILDCEDMMWVRGRKRKYCRKVLYAHFSLDVLGRDFIIYHICEPEDQNK